MSDPSPSPKTPSRRMDLRTMLPGLGSGGILVAAAVLAFAAIAGFVAFDGAPRSSGDEPRSEIAIRADSPAASATVDGPGARPARSGDGPAGRPGAEPGDDASPAPGAGAADPPASSPQVPSSDPPPGSDIGPAQPPAGGEPPAAPTPNPIAPESPAPAGGNAGDVSSIVNEVDETIESVTGIDPGIAAIADPVTKPMDQAIGSVTGGQTLGLGDVEIPDVERELPPVSLGG